MQASNIPSKFPMPFGAGADASYIWTIPAASQINVKPGAASLTDGFPPICFSALDSGGIPPFGQDFNGLLNQLTAWAQWQASGGPVSYDATFSTAIGGYPKNAVLAAVAGGGACWINLVDNNTTNPDAGGANWKAFTLGGLSISQIITSIIAAGAFQQIVVNPVIYVDPVNGNGATANGTSGSPFKTIPVAIAYGADQYNFASSTLTIQLLAGTHTLNGSLSIPYVSGSLKIVGNDANSSATTITATSPISAMILNYAPSATISGVTLLNPGNVTTIAAASGNIAIDHCVFECPNGMGTNGFHLQVNATGSINDNGNNSYSGSGAAWLFVNGGSFTSGNLSATPVVTITFAGTPTFTIGTIYVGPLSSCSLLPGLAFAGAVNASTPEYNVSVYGLLGTSGRTTGFIPGTSASNTNNGHVS